MYGVIVRSLAESTSISVNHEAAMASNEGADPDGEIDPVHLFSLLSSTLGQEIPLRRFYCHGCTHNFMYRGTRNPADDTVRVALLGFT